MEITLYGAVTCPRCTVLEAKLKNAGIPYTKITDNDIVVAKGEEIGVKTLPFVCFDGEYVTDFKEATRRVNELMKKD